MKSNEARGLLARWLVGEALGQAEMQALRAALRETPELMDEAAEHVAMNRLLTHRHESSLAGDFTAEVLARVAGAGRIGESGDHDRRGMSRRQWLGSAAAAAIACGAGAWWFSGKRGGSPAWIGGVAGAHWPEGGMRRVGEKLPLSGRVRLLGGFAAIHFARGVEVVLEGVGDFEVLGENRAVIHQGSVAVFVPPEAEGFVLEGPGGRVIESGRAFAVSARGRAMDVHVLEGQVEVEPRGKTRVRVEESRGLRLEGGRTKEIEAMPESFLTNLPPHRRENQKLNWLHWSFDEGSGDYVEARGRGIGLERARGELTSEDEGGATPRWADGMFGGGLEFSGKKDVVLTDFAGIGGGSPRTVACWVRVPKDLKVSEGYALVSWGAHQQPGDTWQVSVNPTEKDGPFGCLRVGTHEGHVIGSTDLRDDRWHHIAAVLYPGRPADVSTHVLLFVDGRLEAASVKTVRTVNTDVFDPGAKKVGFGRNTGGSGSRLQNLSFRGAMDEVYLVRAALSQEEIVALMKGHGLEGK